MLSCFVAFALLFTFYASPPTSSHALDFDFSTLTLSNLKLLGDAHLKNGTICLSRDLPVPNSGAGRALYSKPIRLRQSSSLVSFSSFFSFSVSNLNPSSIGGGLAFLLSSDDSSLGSAGGFLGLVNSAAVTSSSTAAVVAVEFDTLMDVMFQDINGNHVGVDVNSLVSAQVADLGAAEVDLKSGDLINAWIDYDGQGGVLNVSVSYSNLRPASPLLSNTVDLAALVGDFVYVGFSGSTQGSTEVHGIEWWSFSSSLPGVPAQSVPPPPPAAPREGSSNPALRSPSPALEGSTSEPQRASRYSCRNSLCSRGPAAVAGVATAGVFFLAIFAALLAWVVFSKRLRSVETPEPLTAEIVRNPREFRYRELRSATWNFDPARVIGHGAFGTVYKGIVPETGAIVAVKRCSHGGAHGRAEFLSELSIIATLRHRNLVRLHGWCQERSEILLVYDFMPNGSLDKALFDAPSPLTWCHRRKILMGIASALAYLHYECETQVIHRDVKASNVMLDEAFNARLGDFGLAKQVEHDKSPDATVTAGTMGYLAPEYLLTGRASEKTDVFSYGAVILEVACGRRPIEKENCNGGGGASGANLVEWVWRLHGEGRVLEAADRRIQGEFGEEEMRRVLMVGLLCSHRDSVYRPSMRNVMQMLSGEAELPAVPVLKPSLSYSTSHLLLNLQDSVSDYNAMVPVSGSSSSSSNTFILDRV